MQKRMKDYLEELRRQKKRRRKAGIAVMLLVVLVVGTVAGGLTQYGVAMTGDVKCGLTEHEHTEECYEDVLICGYDDTDISQEEEISGEDTAAEDTKTQDEQEQKNAAAQEGHQHTKDCYELEDVLECGLEETEGHTHGKDCYEEEPTLVCETEESEGHAHDDSCYETEEVLDCEEEHEHTAECYQTEDTLTCETEESEGHTHEDGCYESESVITCKEEESEGHTHGEDCYKQEEILTCDKEEGKEEPVEVSASETDTAPKTTVEENTDAEQHIHTEDCYERQLVCGLEEHQHTDECLIDLSADVEDMSVWDALYADTEWTDSWGEDLVTAARMQIGYRESLDNYQIAEDGSHKGYTRYGEFVGDPYVDWDAAFVNFCMYYAGLAESGLFPDQTDAGEWTEEFLKIQEAQETEKEYLADPEGYTPKPGDFVFFEEEEENAGEDETSLHMGIVSSYDEETHEIEVIEGDSDNEVKENTYEADDSRIGRYLEITELEADYKDENISELPGGNLENHLTEEEQAQVDAVIALIEALPSMEEVAEQFMAFEEAEDEEGYEAYYQELYAQVLEAKNAYDALTEIQKQAVTNAEKLMQYEWLWTATLEEADSVWGIMGEDEAYVNEIVINKISTGAAPFDKTEGPGNDTTDTDKIVRTFDTVTYHFSINMKSWESSKSYSQARVKLEFVLPLTEKEAVFDQSAMAWMDQTEGYKPMLTEETREIDGTETDCQVLTCYKLLLPSAGNQSVVPGDFGENVTINVRSMKNGQKFAPIISAAMEGGAWDDPCSNKDHQLNGQPAVEKKSVTADKVEVTAAPKYNIQVDGSSTYKDTFDFQGDADWMKQYGNVAANTNINTPVPGRMMKLGITLQLYNDNASKGLKGIEFPEGDITFDLAVSSKYTINQPVEGYHQEDVIDVTKDYRPLLWSCGGNKWHDVSGEWNPDGRAIHENLGCSALAPYNGGGGQNGCWQGGTWRATQDKNGIHITVSGYEINPESMPKKNGDNAAGDYGANIGCFSAGEFWIVQPFNTIGNESTNPNFEIVKTYGQGAFATTVKAENLHTKTVSDAEVIQGQGGFEQMVRNDDEVTRTLELVLPGVIQNRVRYASAADIGKGSGIEDSRDGRDYAAVGTELYLMGGFSYNAMREEKNQLYLGTNLLKFYGSAIELQEDSWLLSFTGGACLAGKTGDEAKEHVVIRYATKTDGTDWKSDEELKGTYEDGLKFYRSLKEIPEGHLCVGILISFTGPGAPANATDPYYNCFYKAKVREDMDLAGKTYMMASTSRVWTKDTFEKYGLEAGYFTDWAAPGTTLENSLISKEHLTSGNIEGSTWYSKETYKPDGSGIYGTHNSDWSHWGDTLLVIGYKTSITKNLLQKDTDGGEKKTFNLDADQRVVDFRLQPRTYYDQPGTFDNRANITVVDTLPKYLSYKPGSAYFGGTYEQTSSLGGTKGNIIESNSEETAFPVPVLREPEITKNADGTQTLTWIIEDVEIGEPMAPIYYSADIGAKGNPDEDVPIGTTNLKNVVFITTPYDMRDPMNTAEKHAEAGIAVTRGSASSFGKYTKQRVTDEDGQIDYVVYYNNNAETGTSLTVMDTMPANGVGGSHFTGTYSVAEWKIDTTKCEINKISIYYTFDSKYQDQTTHTVTQDEIRQWKKASINSDGNVSMSEGGQKPPVAWAIVGTLEAGRSVFVDLKLQLEPGTSGSDKKENNYFVNRLSSGDTTTTTETPTVRRTLEGLTWMDHNRDGIQNEETSDRISGVKVTLLKLRENGKPEEEADYEEVCYPQTNTPISIQTGQQISLRAGSANEAAVYEPGRYKFTDLPAGTFAVCFESGDKCQIQELRATGKDCGDNDNTDSDAEAFYTENGLSKTIIWGIEMPKAEDLSVMLYESKFHDSGFFSGVPLTIRKTDEGGKSLSGATFTMSDASGRILSFTENDGSYRAVTEADVVSSAYVYIAYASDTRYVLGVDGTGNGAKAQLQLKNDSSAQQFRMYAQEDGSVSFQHRTSGRWLDLDGGKTEDTGLIHLWEDNNTPTTNQNQKWFLRSNGESYKIQASRASNTDKGYMNLNGGDTGKRQGTQIWIWHDDNTPANNWKLISVKSVGEPAANLTVGSDGTLKIEDLMPGRYKIRELTSPEGYALLDGPIEIEVEKTGTVKVLPGSDMASATEGVLVIRNEELYELPSAGGVGIYWYTVSGTLLMMAGILVLYRKKYAGRC